MKIKVTDAKILKLERECEIARKVMRNMDVGHVSQTEGEATLEAMTKPHREKIDAVLADVQKNARARLLYAYEVRNAASEAERMLDNLNVPATLRKGSRFEVYAEGSNVSRSYKYDFSATVAILERGSASKAWYLVDAGRDTFYAGSGGQSNLKITPAARKHAVRSLHESLVEGIAA